MTGHDERQPLLSNDARVTLNKTSYTESGGHRRYMLFNLYIFQYLLICKVDKGWIPDLSPTLLWGQ